MNANTLNNANTLTRQNTSAWCSNLAVALALLLMPAASPAQSGHFFTTDTSTNYGHSVSRNLAQLLVNGSYRTVAGIHLQETKLSNGAWSMEVNVNYRSIFNYSYSTARLSRYASVDTLSIEILKRLQSRKLAVTTKK